MNDEVKTTHTLSKPELQSQIEQFTNYTPDMAAGGSSKAVMAAVGAKSRDLYQVPLKDIYVEPGLNPRTHDQMYFDNLEVLATDIFNNGFYQDKPLAGYIAKKEGRDVIVLVDGHRRYAAAQIAVTKGAQIEALPVVLKDKSIGMEGLTLALLHSNEGQPFTTYEKAVIAKRLKAFGWENGRIAIEMRCTAAFVGQLLDLAGAPQAIQQMVQAGHLAATEAQRLVKEHGEDATAVASEALVRAKAAGRNKITAKDITPKERKEKLARKHGYALYLAIVRLYKVEKVVKAIPDEEDKKINILLDQIEAKAPPPKAPKAAKAAKKAPAAKAPKAPKAAKAPAAKKAPIAKKIAKVAAKKAPKAAPQESTAAAAADASGAGAAEEGTPT